MRQELALLALKDLGCATTSEICEYVGASDGGQLNELEKYGFITCLGVVLLKDGGTVRRWRLTA